MIRHCLWLARTLPFPQTAGDRIYSAKLAGALARAGAEVTFAGFAGDAPAAPVDGVSWSQIAGRQRNRVAALASPMPLVAARHATSAYRAALTRLAPARPWDTVVIDQYGMGWVLRHRAMFRAGRPTFVFVSHDHEESLTRLQWQDRTASPLVRLHLAQNHWKTRWFERAVARRCGLVTTITDADADLFAATAPGVPTLVLTPGYDGARLAHRLIDASTPRSVILFGSYRWSAKQANLKIFLDRADQVMAKAGIQVCVVGDMPDDFRSAMAGRYRSATFTGFVDDPAPHLAAARLAVVAEPIGGGFKMKLLQYVFNRVPVAALSSCAAGLPSTVRDAMLLRPDLDGLVSAVIAMIDDIAVLNQMQSDAYAAADGAFDWLENGRRLSDAVGRLPSRAPMRPTRPADASRHFASDPAE